jgi:hypothetical protein
MNVRVRRVLVLFFTLCSGMAIDAQDADRRARIAVLEVANPDTDVRLGPACSAVGDTVDLTLRLMGRYAVLRQPEVGLAADLTAFRRWCAEQKVDQAVFGEVRARSAGGYAVTLRVYDRLQDRVTIEREKRADGILDMFEATDAAVLAIIEALSGVHITFGTIELLRQGESGEYVVVIDGVEAGRNLPSVRNVLTGSRTVVVRQQRLTGWVELARSVVSVPEDAAVVVPFAIPHLTPDEAAKLAVYDSIINGSFYEVGTLGIVEEALRDAIAFLGQAPHLPSLVRLRQDYEVKRGLHAVVEAESKLLLFDPSDQAFTMLRTVEDRAGTSPRPAEIKAEAGEAMQRTFALLRLSAISELAAGRWQAAAARYNLLQSVVDRGLLEAPPTFADERAFVAASYAEFSKGWAIFTSGAMSGKIKAWFGPLLDAGAAVIAGLVRPPSRELIVLTEPPGVRVVVNGTDVGVAPIRIQAPPGGTVRVAVSDPWFGARERTVPLRGLRTLVPISATAIDDAAAKPNAKPAERTGTDVWSFAWNPVAEAAGYDVQVLSESKGNKILLANVPGIAGNGHVLKRKLEAGSRYTYRVRPVNRYGGKGRWGPEAFFKGQIVWQRYDDIASISGTGLHQIAFRDALWVFPGSSEAGSQPVWRIGGSGDAERVLEEASFGPRSGFGLCAFKDRLWVIGGGRGAKKMNGNYMLQGERYSNDVWVSSDGLSWTQVGSQRLFPERTGAICLSFAGRMWVLGGNGLDSDGKGIELRDVWSSSDGIDWRKEPGELPYQAGASSGAVFRGRIWVFGSSLTSSSDGIAWTVEPAVPPAPGFNNARVAAYKDRLWLFYGQQHNGRTAQQAFESGVFMTNDGKSWEHPFLGSEAFMLRDVGSTYTEFDGKLWLLGGAWDPPYRGANDLWAGTFIE